MRNEGKKWAGGDSVTGTWGPVDDLVSREKHPPTTHTHCIFVPAFLGCGLHLLGSCGAGELIHSANIH